MFISGYANTENVFYCLNLMFVYDIRQTLVNVFARRTAKNVQVSVENVAPGQKRSRSQLSADGAFNKLNS